jgi:DNA sulfur modification protein DndC
MFGDIRNRLRQLYLEDPRPWLVGFSGGKDSTLLAALIFEVVASIPQEERLKSVSVLCTDTRVEIPAIAEMVEGTLAKMQHWSEANELRIDTHLLSPPPEQSFWVNIIGRGYPPPNRFFRWCTQRLKIDPVSEWVERHLGLHGTESGAILHLGARRAESATRANSLARRETSTATADTLPLHRHADLPRVWIANPIEYFTTGEVWAYLLQTPNPWDRPLPSGGNGRRESTVSGRNVGERHSNRQLYQLYANASGGECPLVVDKTSASCGNSRFGCWTCTVVERDRASEGLLASGDERMERLLAFRERLQFYRDPANGKRDTVGTKGGNHPGPILMQYRRELLAELLQLQEETGMPLISKEELFFIQRFWKSARDPDLGDGVARIISQHRGVPMNEIQEEDRLHALEDRIAKEKGVRIDILRRMLAKVADYGEMGRAQGLPDDLLQILNDELRSEEPEPATRQ